MQYRLTKAYFRGMSLGNHLHQNQTPNQMPQPVSSKKKNILNKLQRNETQLFFKIS